jgi:hypothetical protein
MPGQASRIVRTFSDLILTTSAKRRSGLLSAIGFGHGRGGYEDAGPFLRRGRRQPKKVFRRVSMRPMDAQNRLPEVATDQFALDRTLKHLRKLRWIGKESEAEKILAVLDVRRRQTTPSRRRAASRL